MIANTRMYFHAVRYEARRLVRCACRFYPDVVVAVTAALEEAHADVGHILGDAEEQPTALAGMPLMGRRRKVAYVDVLHLADRAEDEQLKRLYQRTLGFSLSR